MKLLKAVFFSQVTALAVIPMNMDYGILVGTLIVGGFIVFFIMCKVSTF